MFLSDLPIRTRLWFQAVKDQLNHWQPFTRSLTPARRWLELSALEERVFLSASPAGAVIPESMEVAVPVDPGAAQHSDTSNSAQSNANQGPGQGRDLIFHVDSPWQQLDFSKTQEDGINVSPTGIGIGSTHMTESGDYWVGRLLASDPDPEETLTFSIQGGADASLFSVEDRTNFLYFNVEDLDFESKPSYEVLVRVTDSANNTYEKLITFTGVDRNAAPLLGDFTLQENTPAGTFVGTIATPGGDGATYEIVGGSHKDSFALDPTTGELFVANPEKLNYEFWHEFELIVRVTDSQGAVDMGLIHVSLTNISIPPIAVDDVEGGTLAPFFFRNEDFTRNDISPEGEKLIVIGFGDLKGAKIINHGDYTYTYLPPEDVTEGPFTFTYFVQDRSGNIAIGTMTIIRIYPIDHNPDPVLSDVLPIFPNAVPQTPLRPATSAPALSPVPMNLPPAALSALQTSALVDQSEKQNASLSNPPMALLAAAAPGSLPHRESGVFFVAPNEGEEVFQAVFTESSGEASVPQILTVAHSPGEIRAWSADSWNSQGNSTSTLPSSSSASTPENDPVVIDLSPGGLVWQDLDTMQEDLQSQMDFQTMAVGAAVTVSSTLTVGYVLWMVRGGVLVGSLLAQMPAWRFVDPLPILEHLDQSLDDADDQESLEAIIANTQIV